MKKPPLLQRVRLRSAALTLAVLVSPALIATPVLAGGACGFGIVGVICQDADSASSDERAGSIRGSVNRQNIILRQTVAATYGVNSTARIVGQTVYVPSTTKWDNRAPSYSPAYQTTVQTQLARGKTMEYAQSMALNGPSYTSFNSKALSTVKSSGPAAVHGAVCSARNPNCLR